MAKKETLNSDMDFIREFEELKIKQRLLIENLKKKGHLDQDKLFLEINAKLDFLVKIFKESNSTESSNKDETHEGEIVGNSEVLVKKLDEFSKLFNEKFVSIEDQLTQIYKKLNNDVNLGNNISKNNNISSQVVEVGNNVNSELPPKPDFQAKIEDIKGSTEDKKSKKWF